MFPVQRRVYERDEKIKIAKAEQGLREYQSKYETIKETSDSLEKFIEDLEEDRQEDVIKVAELFQSDELVEEMRLSLKSKKRKLTDKVWSMGWFVMMNW